MESSSFDRSGAIAPKSLEQLREGHVWLSETARGQPHTRFSDGTQMQLLVVVFSGFGDMGLVAGFGHSFYKRVSACGS
jgi:hypothetical protein